MSFIDIVRKMVIDSDIGARAVAGIVGKKYHVLMNELNSENTSHKLGADILEQLMKACRSDVPMHHLAASMGGLFIRIPKAECSKISLIKAIKEFGELIAVCGQTIENGSLSNNEKKIIRQKGQASLTAIQELLYGLEGSGNINA